MTARIHSFALCLSLLALTAPAAAENFHVEARIYCPASLTLDPAAKLFFENEGTDLVDAYFPWLGDIMPTSNWVHIIMLVSVLFNLMGIWHRFRLWRLDANRVKAELYLPFIFGFMGVRPDNLTFIVAGFTLVEQSSEL